MAANPFLSSDAALGTPVDTIFEGLTLGESAPGDEQTGDYASRIRGMISDAREFCAEVLMPRRVAGMQLYLGMIPEIEGEGKSTIVKTEVRDTILQMLPSVMRIFTAQDAPTNFIPGSEASVPMAEQANDYVQYVLMHDNPGYMIFQDIFKDAMIKGMGIAQWWTDDDTNPIQETYSGLSIEQRQFVISQGGVEVLDMQMVPNPGPQGQIVPTFDLTIRRTKRARTHRVSSVPPDEFRINRHAVSIKEAALTGRERFATQTELVKKGVPRELIEQHRDFSGGDLRFTEERMLRNPGSDSPFGRDAMEPVVRFGEYWIRADKDDDGIAELRHICVLGDDAVIISDEPAVRPKMALCCCDPEPHTIVGHSISELVFDLQVIGSNLLRGALDNLSASLYSRIWGVETQVNWDDVLNPAIGAPIRVKDPNALGQFTTPFVGDAAFGMLDRLDALRMARTGITPQSQGLDPKALQSTTLKGVDMIVTGAQERIELVCRTMASTFMVDLMAGLLQEVTDNPAPERIIELRGNYVPVNPSQFDATMRCVPNPAMGRGSDMDRYLMLGQILAKQELIMQSQGPMNPMVTPMEYRNAFEDLLKIAGMRNCTRYFKAITPESMKEFQEMLQKKEDPNMIYARAEADKVRAEVVKTLAQARTTTEEMSMKDDRERDKNETDALLKAAQIDAQYGAAVDTAAIRALWSAPRVPPGEPGASDALMDGGGMPPQPGAGVSPMSGQPPAPGPKTPPLPLRSALGPEPPKLMEPQVGPPKGLLGPS